MASLRGRGAGAGLGLLFLSPEDTYSVLSHLLCCFGTCYLHFSAKKQFAEHMLFLTAMLPQLCSPGQGCVSHPGACQPAAGEALAPLHFASPCPRAELGRQLLRLCRCLSLPPHLFPIPGVSAHPPSCGTVVVGLLLDLSLSSTAQRMQVHKQFWTQLLSHTTLCLGSRSLGSVPSSVGSWLDH